MKINLKARLRNKAFITGACALIVSFVYHILVLLDIVPNVTENEIMEVFAMAINILAFMVVLTDPTTKGIFDSDRAMTYCTDCDVRKREKEENDLE